MAGNARDLEAIADALGVDRFCVWGISGGGAPALAAAALLPERVAAAAALAAVAPYGAEGLDYFDGMGELNVEGTRLLLDGGHEAFQGLLEEGRTMIMHGSAEDTLEFIGSLISDVDRRGDHARGASSSRRRRPAPASSRASADGSTTTSRPR